MIIKDILPGTLIDVQTANGDTYALAKTGTKNNEVAVVCLQNDAPKPQIADLEGSSTTYNQTIIKPDRIEKGICMRFTVRNGTMPVVTFPVEKITIEHSPKETEALVELAMRNLLPVEETSAV